MVLIWLDQFGSSFQRLKHLLKWHSKMEKLSKEGNGYNGYADQVQAQNGAGEGIRTPEPLRDEVS